MQLYSFVYLFLHVLSIALNNKINEIIWNTVTEKHMGKVLKTISITIKKSEKSNFHLNCNNLWSSAILLYMF